MVVVASIPNLISNDDIIQVTCLYSIRFRASTNKNNKGVEISVEEIHASHEGY